MQQSGHSVANGTAVPLLRIGVINGFSVSCAGRDIRLRGRKARALLAFLGLGKGAGISRERLVGLFWADVDEDKARASLRQSLKELRDAIDPDEDRYLRFGRSEIALLHEHVSTDLDEMLAALDKGPIPAALIDRPHLAEAILGELDDVSPDFHIWLAGFRQSCQQRLTAALTHRIHVHDMAQDQLRLDEACQALLNLDPTNEMATRHLIRLRAAAGDSAGALRLYGRLWDLLEAEYDIEPAPETQAMIVEIKRGPGAPSPTAGAKPAADAPLHQAARLHPVITLSGMAGLDLPGTSAALLMSFRHELMACLVRFREWAIIDGTLDQAVAKPARPDFAIDLSSYPTGNGSMIIMTLRDAVTQQMVWSDRYTLDAQRWFDVQREIIRQIAVALRINISAETLQSRLPMRPRMASLHDLWIKGQALFNGYAARNWDEAEQIFRDIIRQDPHFSPAYSSLTQLRNSRHLAAPGLWRSAETTTEALDLAGKAAQTDPMDSRAHLCLAWTHAMSGRYELALPYYRSAVALNENDPWTLTSACQGLAFLGEHETAQELEQHLFRISPALSRTQWGYLVGTRFLRGDYAGAITASRHASDQISNLPGWTAAALAMAGRESEARAEFARFVALITAIWKGPQPADARAVTRWFLHNFPIAQRLAWERLRDGIAEAGAPFIGHAEREPAHIGIEGQAPPASLEA